MCSVFVLTCAFVLVVLVTLPLTLFGQLPDIDNFPPVLILTCYPSYLCPALSVRLCQIVLFHVLIQFMHPVHPDHSLLETSALFLCFPVDLCVLLLVCFCLFLRFCSLPLFWILCWSVLCTACLFFVSLNRLQKDVCFTPTSCLMHLGARPPAVVAQSGYIRICTFTPLKLICRI